MTKSGREPIPAKILVQTDDNPAPVLQDPGEEEDTRTEEHKYIDTLIDDHVAALTSAENEPWYRRWWRPGMAWLYMLICACDFIIFPILSMSWAAGTGTAWQRWEPITLQSGGVVHIAFGVIIGTNIWTRGNERLQFLQRK